MYECGGVIFSMLNVNEREVTLMLGFESSLHHVCPYKGLQLLVQRQRGLVCAFALMRLCMCVPVQQNTDSSVKSV